MEKIRKEMKRVHLILAEKCRNNLIYEVNDIGKSNNISPSLYSRIDALVAEPIRKQIGFNFPNLGKLKLETT